VLAALVKARELAHEIVETAAGGGKLAQREPSEPARRRKFVNEPVKTSSTTPTSPTGTTGSAPRPAPSPSTSASTSSTQNKWYPDHAVMSGATKESLKSMAAFKFD